MLRGVVRRIFVTHFHPDHVGAAADVAELTGAATSSQPSIASPSSIRTGSR
ncbi:MAG: MBL fold metallo-hydrolase [Gaiellaceae bacterium]